MESLIKASTAEVGEIEPVSLFEHIKIETNSVCTRQCWFCHFGLEKRPIKSRMSSTLVYRLIDELADLDYRGRVGLFETNEPLTDKRIYSFIAYASKRLPRAWHMLITNGDLLNQKVLERLFKECGLNQLGVSIYDDATQFKLERLLAASPYLCDRVELIDSRNSSKDNRGGNVLVQITPKLPLLAPCERVNKVMVIKADGKAVSCFGDYYGVNYLGNVYQQTLLSIWYGREYTALRDSLDRGERTASALCAKCDYPGKGGYFGLGQNS